MTDVLLSPDQVAERLPGVSDWWVRQQLNAGKLRGHKVGRRWFVPESAIDELLAAGSNQVTAGRRRRRRTTPDNA